MFRLQLHETLGTVVCGGQSDWEAVWGAGWGRSEPLPPWHMLPLVNELILGDHPSLTLGSGLASSGQPPYLSDVHLSGAVTDPVALLLCPVRIVMSHVFADDWLPVSSCRGTVDPSRMVALCSLAPYFLCQHSTCHLGSSEQVLAGWKEGREGGRTKHWCHS